MKLVTWNVNGLRACLKKGFEDSVRGIDPDVLCLQETKMQPGQAEVDLPEYKEYYCGAEKRGYSGTACFLQNLSPPVSNTASAPTERGQSIIADYGTFYLVNVYVPNAQDGLKRIDYRMEWEDDFRAFVQELDKEKPVIICGDMNVAHEEIDLKESERRGNAGFSDQERGKMTELLNAGFIGPSASCIRT